MFTKEDVNPCSEGCITPLITLGILIASCRRIYLIVVLGLTRVGECYEGTWARGDHYGDHRMRVWFRYAPSQIQGRVAQAGQEHLFHWIIPSHQTGGDGAAPAATSAGQEGSGNSDLGTVSRVSLGTTPAPRRLLIYFQDLTVIVVR